MTSSPESQAFSKGRLMQVVKAGEEAQEILKTKKVSASDRAYLQKTIEQGESAKKTLRKMGVELVEEE